MRRGRHRRRLGRTPARGHADALAQHADRQRLEPGPQVGRQGGAGVEDHLQPAEEAAAEFVVLRSEEPTSELQSLMRISYAVFCLKKKKNKDKNQLHQMVSMSTYWSM